MQNKPLTLQEINQQQADRIDALVHAICQYRVKSETYKARPTAATKQQYEKAKSRLYNFAPQTKTLF